MALVNGFFVDRPGLSAALALLWNEEVDLMIASYSRGHIDVIISDEESGLKWRLTSFYGHTDVVKRKGSWELLSMLSDNIHLPWLCFGDFNEVLERDEKFGKLEKNWSEIYEFKKAIDEVGLMDLGFKGNKFTWCNRREADATVYLRLDSALANLGWQNLCPGMEVKHLAASHSDHVPIKVEIKR